METTKVTVLGTGAWGTTFAQVLADAGHEVTMWGRNQSVVEFINSHENSTYLPGIELDEKITATTDLQQAVADSDVVAMAVPTAVVGEICAQVLPGRSNITVVSLAKGIELDTKRTVFQVIVEEGQIDEQRVAVLSGPNLSREIADRNPTATAVASPSIETATQVARLCHNSYFRPYVSTDVTGCEMAGATKNVIALAIGAAEGLGLGINTRATLMTRGLAEMTRLGIAMGARPGTYAGLAGMGDLIATCSSRLSRNYSLGYRLGRGMSLDEALALSPGVAEGARSAVPVLQIAAEYEVDMPITAAVVKVLAGQASIDEMGAMLLGRPQKMDGWEIELLD